MNNLAIFTEEPSMKAALENILPNCGVDRDHVRIIPHQGVSDLEGSLCNKLRAWGDPNARFLVLRDNDRGDCKERKAKLLDIIERTGKGDRSRVRIVCQELEAWFLGDVTALRRAGLLKTKGVPAVLRGDPDAVPYPARVLKTFDAAYQKVSGARKISAYLDPKNNRSTSFQQTITAIWRLTR